MSDLQAQVMAWLEADPDPATRAELTALAGRAFDAPPDPQALADLGTRFTRPLEFGTAGLRGALGAGPGRMNLAVVLRAAYGLMAYLLDQVSQLSTSDSPLATINAGEPVHRRVPMVVIGYDARLGSKAFAEATAQVVAAEGGHAVLFGEVTPTPLLAFAVRYLQADAGVQVTASHNPAGDNGYKVYLGGRMASPEGNGVQIVPPEDGAIAARIAAAPPANQVPRAVSGWTTLGPDLAQAYLERATTLIHPAGPLRIVHTALHGVGSKLALRAFSAAGFTDVHPVKDQQAPDPAFPTVAFPNPEEPGAIDLALDLARQVQADLVLAHDPDADRCAAAIFDPRFGPGGGWRMLSGDEVGCLLGQAAAQLAAQAHDIRSDQSAVASASLVNVPRLASSVVSSRLLPKIAASYGLDHASTLTGFKWIARVTGLVFGYEEAIGFCCRPDLVRDKDGITAGLAIAELAAGAKAEGRTLIDLLDDLARRYGLHATSQVSVRIKDPASLPDLVGRLRQAPPRELGGLALSRLRSLVDGLNGLPPSDGLVLELAGDARVVVRPSGTEPKIKCYLEVIEPVAPQASFAAVSLARAAAAKTLAAIAQDMVAWLTW